MPNHQLSLPFYQQPSYSRGNHAPATHSSVPPRLAPFSKTSAAQTVRLAHSMRITSQRAVRRGTLEAGAFFLFSSANLDPNRRTICTGTAPDSPPTAFPTAPVSYVPNTYFSFPYAATTYPNSAACESAVSVCSRNYEVCTSGLGGGSGFAVTIDVPGGGGVTVDGTGANLGPAVTSVCSSLSSEACSDMEATSCDTFGPDSASATTRTGLGLVMVFLLGSVSVLMP